MISLDVQYFNAISRAAIEKIAGQLRSGQKFKSQVAAFVV